MKWAGTITPSGPLRSPVSSSCAIRILTSTWSACATARIFIGSATTASYRDLDLLARHVDLPARHRYGHHVRGLVHLDARGHPGLRSLGKEKAGRQRERILVDQDVDLLRACDAAL